MKCKCEICKEHEVMSEEWIRETLIKANKELENK